MSSVVSSVVSSSVAGHLGRGGGVGVLGLADGHRLLREVCDGVGEVGEVGVVVGLVASVKV